MVDRANDAPPDPLSYRGWVEREALRFDRQSLIDLLLRLNLWGKDTVHEMQGKRS